MSIFNIRLEPVCLPIELTLASACGAEILIAAPADSILMEIAPALFITGVGGVGSEGPAGPPGPQGDPGQIRFTGIGAPPPAIVGANPGDTYLDIVSGNIYKLT